MDVIDFPRYVFALAAVLGLIGLAAALLRKFNVSGFSTAAVKTRRLRVMESLTLDAKRRVVIVRRDNVDHLLLLGADRETVLEAGVPLAAAAATPAALRVVADADGANAPGAEGSDRS